MKLPLIALFLTSSIVVFAQVELEQLDGNVTESERQSFELLGQNGASQIAVTQIDDYLKISVVSDTMYVASLCLCTDGKETIVLHASAALGDVKYQSESKELWTSNDKFDWQMREKDMSEESINKRRAYLKKYGWVANTLGMGSGQVVEFIVSKTLLNDSTIMIAAGLMPQSNPESIIALPAKNSGDCAAYSLVAGSPESTYQFRPQGWYQVKL